MTGVTTDRRSLAAYVRGALLEMLRDEQYTPGARLASEQELALRFATSRATVREALKNLVQAGILECRHGKGYFVQAQDPVIHKPVMQLQSVTELLADIGYVVENRVLSVREEAPTGEVRRTLHLPSGASVIRLERLRASQGKPLIYSIDVFPRRLIPGPWQDEPWDGSLFQRFSAWNTPVARSRATIRAVTLPPEQCAAIGVTAGQPWLYTEQVCMDGRGTPMLFSQNYYRDDIFAFYVVRERL